MDSHAFSARVCVLIVVLFQFLLEFQFDGEMHGHEGCRKCVVGALNGRNGRNARNGMQPLSPPAKTPTWIQWRMRARGSYASEKKMASTANHNVDCPTRGIEEKERGKEVKNDIAYENWMVFVRPSAF
jgi:hypothetical protein